MYFSTFAFIDFSPTSPNFHFTIHSIFETTFADCIEALILSGNSGIFGAGGNNGNSICTSGINDGSSGNEGGEGNKGTFQKLIEAN